jgi:hypothetical protein
VDDNSETRARAGVRVRVGLCLEVFQDIVEQEEDGTGEGRRGEESRCPSQCAHLSLPSLIPPHDQPSSAIAVTTTALSLLLLQVIVATERTIHHTPCTSTITITAHTAKHDYNHCTTRINQSCLAQCRRRAGSAPLQLLVAMRHVCHITSHYIMSPVQPIRSINLPP